MIKKVEESYKKHLVALIGGPLIKLVEAVFDLLIPLFMKAIIDLNQFLEPSNISNPITRYLAYFIRLFPSILKDNRYLSDALIGGIIILLMGIVGFFITMIAQYIASSTAMKISTEIRNDLYQKILSINKKERNEFSTDHLLTLLNNDTYQIQQGILIYIRLIARAPFIILGSLIFSFLLDYRIGLAFLGVTPLILLVIFLVLRKAKKNYVDIQNQLDVLSNKTSDTIDGNRVIRAFNSEEKENEDFNNINDKYHKLSIGVNKINSLINPLTFALTSIVLIIIMLIIQNSLFSSSLDEKTFLASTLIAEMAYLSQIFFTTVQLTGVLLDLTKARVARGRINKVLMYQNKMINGKELIIDNEDNELLRFINVYFSYVDEGDNYCLKNINFSINKGETLGIIGGIGSGKSTIISLIERFFDVSKGEIIYKNKNIKDYDIHSLRNDISYVSQKPALFKGDIKSNISMSNINGEEKDIINSIKNAEAEEFISNYEDYLSHEVKEKGKNYSGGQKQRISLARGLNKKCSLIILDDSTSSLDLITEKKILTHLYSLKEMSKIIISSRISSIINADKIIVMDKGEIAAIDNHINLLKNCSLYKEIYDSQMKKGDL